jgi:hypothetical protein
MNANQPLNRNPNSNVQGGNTLPGREVQPEPLPPISNNNQLPSRNAGTINQPAPPEYNPVGMQPPPAEIPMERKGGGEQPRNTYAQPQLKGQQQPHTEAETKSVQSKNTFMQPPPEVKGQQQGQQQPHTEAETKTMMQAAPEVNSHQSKNTFMERPQPTKLAASLNNQDTKETYVLFFSFFLLVVILSFDLILYCIVLCTLQFLLIL